eukprot:188290-Amphidinium_carterae.1
MWDTAKPKSSSTQEELTEGRFTMLLPCVNKRDTAGQQPPPYHQNSSYKPKDAREVLDIGWIQGGIVATLGGGRRCRHRWLRGEASNNSRCPCAHNPTDRPQALSFSVLSFRCKISFHEAGDRPKQAWQKETDIRIGHPLALNDSFPRSFLKHFGFLCSGLPENIRSRKPQPCSPSVRKNHFNNAAFPPALGLQAQGFAIHTQHPWRARQEAVTTQLHVGVLPSTT